MASPAPSPAPAATATAEPAAGRIEVDERIAAADDGDPDHDDGYDSASASRGSTSLSAGVRDYNFENGRRFHKFKEGRYNYPNDQPEQEREDMKHAMVLHLCEGRLHYAPLKNPQQVVDIGTGTGVWAIDMGDEYPEAEVVGIDLSPIQPTWVPVNVKFLVDDAEDEWVYPPNSLDFVHLRHMGGSIKDWPRLLSQAYKALKPGGWIEIQELLWTYSCDDDTMKPDYGPLVMSNHIRDALAAMGIEMHAAARNPDRVRAAGFTDVRHKVLKVPMGPWARDQTLKSIGLYCRSVVYDGLQAITMGTFTRGLKWTPQEVEVFLIKVRKDLMDARVHSYVFFHSLAGQKPVEGATAEEKVDSQ